MSIAVTYNSQASIVETLEGEYISPGDPTVTTNGLNTTAGLTASTTPPVTKYSAFQKALSGGSGTIDLTSLPDANGVAAQVDFTGLKLQVVKLRNLATNANAITVEVGASNGHTLFGATWEITLQPGDEFLWKGNDNSGVPNVASNNKAIDISGTGSQILEVLLVAG